MAAVPPAWADVPAGLAGEPVLELPLGPDYDSAATFRTIFHGHRVVNGVSGYDPAHYAPLQAGLADHDPGVLAALASLTPFTMIVPRATDPDDEWLRYAMAATGAAVVLRDDEKSVVHVPGHHMTEIRLGKAWPIASVSAFRHDTAVIWDGKVETEWGDNPQRPGQWLVADLGTVREVGGLTHALGEYARDFPRRLAIDVSVDGERWERVWENATAAAAFLAAARGPREAAHRNIVRRVAELQVHAPQKLTLESRRPRPRRSVVRAIEDRQEVQKVGRCRTRSARRLAPRDCGRCADRARCPPATSAMARGFARPVSRLTSVNASGSSKVAGSKSAGSSNGMPLS